MAFSADAVSRFPSVDCRAGKPRHGRAEIAHAAGVNRTTIWRLANSANRDHLATTVERVERLHERIVGRWRFTSYPEVELGGRL